MGNVTIGYRKLCCQNPANLEIWDASNRSLFVRRCKVCGCRHFDAFAEPGTMFARPAGGAARILTPQK